MDDDRNIFEVDIRPLTSDDYILAAQTVARCKRGTLKHVLHFYEKAGFDVAEFEEVRTKGRWAQYEELDMDALIEKWKGSKLTVSEVSRRTGINKQSISCYFKKRKRPSPERYERILDLFDK